MGTELRLQEDEIVEARWFTREELVAALADGSVGVSGRVSIARRLIEHWFGAADSRDPLADRPPCRAADRPPAAS